MSPVLVINSKILLTRPGTRATESTVKGNKVGAVEFGKEIRGSVLEGLGSKEVAGQKFKDKKCSR